MALLTSQGKIRYPQTFVDAAELAGSMILYGNGKSRSTDIDTVSINKKGFLFLEFKKLHNDELFIPKNQFLMYKELESQLYDARVIFVGVERYKPINSKDIVYWVGINQLQSLKSTTKFRETEKGIIIEKEELLPSSVEGFQKFCNNLLDIIFENDLANKMFPPR